jgi:hypothetical protein
VTMKNGVFLDVTPCGSCKNRRIWGTSRLHHQGDKIRWTRNNVSRNVRRTIPEDTILNWFWIFASNVSSYLKKALLSAAWCE